MRFAALSLLLTLSAATAGAEGKGYSIETAPLKVKAGEKARASFRIVAAAPSHVSDEAPLKVALTSPTLKLEKDKLGKEDAVDGKGQSPKFEVPFVAEKKGPATIEANVTFILCNKELCSRETEKVAMSVDVQ